MDNWKTDYNDLSAEKIYNIHCGNYSRNNLMELAIKYNRVDVLKYAFDKQVEYRKLVSVIPSNQSIELGYMDIVRFCMEHHIRYYQFYFSLEIARINGHSDMVELFENSSDCYNNEMANTDVQQFLDQYGVDIDSSSNNYIADLACQHDDMEVLRFLMENSIAPNVSSMLSMEDESLNLFAKILLDNAKNSGFYWGNNLG
ncbi:MAG: hypothetical protein JKX76_00895 [Colwellia sp.]|nr:hypothetical protein [Colwellia sp.]